MDLASIELVDTILGIYESILFVVRRELCCVLIRVFTSVTNKHLAGVYIFKPVLNSSRLSLLTDARPN